MTPNHLAKIKQTLLDMQRSPGSIKVLELEGMARALGRQKVKRGKEPVFARHADPRLSPPLSIPHHSSGLKIGTAKSIVEALLKDVVAWEVFLRECEDD